MAILVVVACLVIGFLVIAISKRNKGGVYGIFNKNTNEFDYVGRTKNVKKRKKEHMKPSKHGKFTYAMFDPEKHDFKILSHTNSQSEEKKFIDELKPKRNKRSYDSFEKK